MDEFTEKRLLCPDRIVPSKIQNAKAKCSKTIFLVKAAIRQCENRLDSIEAEIEILSKRKRKMIEAA